MPLIELSGHGCQLISILEWQLGPLGGDLLLARESEDNKEILSTWRDPYVMPGWGWGHVCIERDRVGGVVGWCKTSCFPLVFQKDGLIWQSKPHSHSHQWATKEGSQQPHTVTSCRCCRKSDRGHFHCAITCMAISTMPASHLEFVFPSVPRIMCCWWRKESPLPFILTLVLRACGIYLVFILFSEVQKSFIFIKVSIFSICSFQ